MAVRKQKQTTITKKVNPPAVMKERAPTKKKVESDILVEISKQVRLLQKAIDDNIFEGDWEWFNVDFEDPYAWLLFKYTGDKCTFAVRYHTEGKKKIFTLFELNELIEYEANIQSVSFKKTNENRASVVFTGKDNNIFTHNILITENGVKI